MQDTKLLETILGITAPWHIARVESLYGRTEKRVICGWSTSRRDGRVQTAARSSRPDSITPKNGPGAISTPASFRRISTPRSAGAQVPTHGVKQVRVPWAEPRSRSTLLMERLVIDLILQCSTVPRARARSPVSVGTRRGASCSAPWGVVRRARPRARFPTSAWMRRRFAKGTGITPIVCDLDRSTVEFGGGDENGEPRRVPCAQLTDDNKKAALQAVAIWDMWEPYIGATRDGLPNDAPERSCSIGSASCAT